MLSHVPLRCAVSIYNSLAQKDRLQISDLYGQNFMVIHRGWNENVDKMRDDIRNHHPQIHIVDFDFLSLRRLIVFQLVRACIHDKKMI